MARTVAVGVKREMRCVGCGMLIKATIVQAKTHGWQVWVGGGRCKACVTQRANEPTVKPRTNKCVGCGCPISPSETICGECACEDDCAP